MINSTKSAFAVSALALSLGICAVPAPASAAGFFEQLFGIAPQPQPAPQAAPASNYDAPQHAYEAPVRRRIKHKVVDEKPKLQKPTDLMHDVTLQTGDAIMMKGGIRIYTGDDRDPTHVKADFEPLNEVSGLSKSERRALVAMNMTGNEPLRGALNTDALASGRSAAEATPVSAGHDIVDAKGKTLRYVGP